MQQNFNPSPDTKHLTACWIILHAILSSADFSPKLIKKNKSLMNTFRNSNSLDLDQARLFVGPDQAHNCSQELADNKSCHKQSKSEYLKCIPLQHEAAKINLKCVSHYFFISFNKVLR